MMILKEFGLHRHSPYDSMVILLFITSLSLLIAVVTLELKQANFSPWSHVQSLFFTAWVAVKR